MHFCTFKKFKNHSNISPEETSPADSDFGIIVFPLFFPNNEAEVEFMLEIEMSHLFFSLHFLSIVGLIFFLIFIWQRRYHLHEGGFALKSLLCFSPEVLTSAVFPNVGNLTAVLGGEGGCVCTFSGWEGFFERNFESHLSVW